MNYSDNYPSMWEQDQAIYPVWDLFPLENELVRLTLDEDYNPSIGELYVSYVNDVFDFPEKFMDLSEHFFSALVDEDWWGGRRELSFNLQLVGDMGRIVIDEFREEFMGLFDQFHSTFSIQPPRIDPLILDLDGDGIETTNIEQYSFFDHDGNGFTERTGWVGADDGLLVMDRNHDGVINDGSELFGDQTLLQNGQQSATGFQALADLDGNCDRKIDSTDSGFVDLKVWRDENSDGFSSANELYTLDELGIKSFSTDVINTNILDSEGNTQARLGSFERIDGTSSQMGDYLLERDLLNTRVLEELDVPGDIQSLPFLVGMGNVYDLHQAMVRDGRCILV